MVVPPQLLGQQGHGTEDGGPHRPRSVARHQAEEHQDQQEKPQLSLFLWVQKQRQKPLYQKGHMKTRNHHHMPQPYAVEVVPVGLLQAGLIPCEKGMEKPSLPGGYSWSSMARISPARMVRAYRTELLSPRVTITWPYPFIRSRMPWEG